MAFSEKQKQQLDAQLNPARVKDHPYVSVKNERTGAWEPAKYIPAFDCFRMANEIFGADGWSTIVHECKRVQGPDEITKVQKGYGGKPDKQKQQWYVAYLAQVEVQVVGGGSHGGCSVGDAYSDIEKDGVRGGVPNHRMAMEAAVTLATKQALKKWGQQFGLFLRDADDPYGEHYAAYLERKNDAPAPPAPDPERTPEPAPEAPPPPPASTPFPEGMARADVERHVGGLIKAIKARTGVHPASNIGKPSDLAALSDDDLAALAGTLETKDIETKETA